MISIQRMSHVSLQDVLRRSPVADRPDAEIILRDCLYRSIEVRYGFVDDELACVWGLIPPSLLSTTAYLWLLTTDVVEDHKFLFVRHSQRWIEQALKTYPTIIGDAVAGNDRGIRWLRWLGAEFGEPEGKRIRFMIRKRNG